MKREEAEEVISPRDLLGGSNVSAHVKIPHTTVFVLVLLQMNPGQHSTRDTQ